MLEISESASRWRQKSFEKLSWSLLLVHDSDIHWMDYGHTVAQPAPRSGRVLLSEMNILIAPTVSVGMRRSGCENGSTVDSRLAHVQNTRLSVEASHVVPHSAQGTGDGVQHDVGLWATGVTKSGKG